jgi:hypothetical protein
MEVNIPLPLEQALLARAAAEKKTPAEAVVDAVACYVGIKSPRTNGQGSADAGASDRDLSDLIGSGGIDEEIEAALWEQRRIEPELWK